MEGEGRRRPVSSGHERSKSDADQRLGKDELDSSRGCAGLLVQDAGSANSLSGRKRRPSLVPEFPKSLKQEIHQLEKRLHDQFAVRRALEKALGHKPHAVCSSNDNPLPKSTRELIKDIAVLELEVMYLERHLLWLYRKAFDTARQQQPMSSPAGMSELDSAPDLPPTKQDPTVMSGPINLPRKSATVLSTKASAANCQGKQHTLGRSHSALSPSAKNLARALKPCHTTPLSFLEENQSGDSGLISLADHLGTTITDHIPETPNKISEYMVRCIAAIYCRLKDNSVAHHGIISSPCSSFSSMSAFSSQLVSDLWSPNCNREATVEAWFDNPLRVNELKRDFSGSYDVPVEVLSLCRAARSSGDIKEMLNNYKSLVCQLEAIDPSAMTNEEKIAFWVNIHNAMMMHAYLEYGIPQSSRRRLMLHTKIAYIINNQSINADMIQGPILGCHIQPPGQFLRMLFLPRSRPKGAEKCRGYAVDHPEPLLYFALCSGSYSDPVVRIYTPKRLYQQLETAKDEYIRANIGIRREQKILLPKIIESYAKDAELEVKDLMNMIERCVPKTLWMMVRRCEQGRPHKIVEWVPQSCAFRYLLSRELADFQSISQILFHEKNYN